MKKRLLTPQELKKLKAPTAWFNELIKRATTPLSELEGRKEEQKKSGENVSERTRQCKAQGAED